MYITEIFNKDREALSVLYNLSKAFGYKKYSKKEYIEMHHNRGYSNDDLDSCLIKIGE